MRFTIEKEQNAVIGVMICFSFFLTFAPIFHFKRCNFSWRGRKNIFCPPAQGTRAMQLRPCNLIAWSRFNYHPRGGGTWPTWPGTQWKLRATREERELERSQISQKDFGWRNPGAVDRRVRADWELVRKRADWKWHAFRWEWRLSRPYPS